MRPEIKTIFDTWIRAVQLQKIILFGSHARGAAGSESDLDFLIVWHNPAMQTNREKAVYLRRLLPREIHVPMDLIVMTPEQYQDAISDPRTFTSLISSKGKVIYESLA